MKKITIFLLFAVQIPVFADELSCKTGIQDMLALFTPKTISCNNNQFLPANSVTCSNCPSGYTCTGGDLVFNEQKSSGIDYTQKISNGANNVCATNFPAELYATWTPKNITCSAGQYLAANAVSCAQCLKDNYCGGGTYAFNETTAQGIEPCPINTPHAPTGSAVCYPHILHIGENNVYLKSTKLTTPSLNIAIEGSIFYANLTTTPTYMNKASEQSLKIMVNGVEYYVCDDTTYSE